MKIKASSGDESCSGREDRRPKEVRNVPKNRNYRFPRTEKLKGRKEIREVFNRKASPEPKEASPKEASHQQCTVPLRRKGVSCTGAKLLVLRNGLSHNRIAFTFSRKFGNAVERNHSRRLSREVYRLLRNELKKGYDLVLLVYPGRDIFSVRMDQLRDLFSRAGLFNSSAGQGSS